jgi:hypothetical protein
MLVVPVGIISLRVVRLHLDITNHRWVLTWQLIDYSIFGQTVNLFGELAPSKCSLQVR